MTTANIVTANVVKIKVFSTTNVVKIVVGQIQR